MVGMCDGRLKAYSAVSAKRLSAISAWEKFPTLKNSKTQAQYAHKTMHEMELDYFPMTPTITVATLLNLLYNLKVLEEKTHPDAETHCI